MSQKNGELAQVFSTGKTFGHEETNKLFQMEKQKPHFRNNNMRQYETC